MQYRYVTSYSLKLSHLYYIGSLLISLSSIASTLPSDKEVLMLLLGKVQHIVVFNNVTLHVVIGDIGRTPLLSSRQVKVYRYLFG